MGVGEPRGDGRRCPFCDGLGSGRAVEPGSVAGARRVDRHEGALRRAWSAADGPVAVAAYPESDIATVIDGEPIKESSSARTAQPEKMYG